MKIRLSLVLKALGRAVILVQDESFSSGDVGLLGLGALPQARDDRYSVIDTARLAAQLSVLAQAARERDDLGTLGLLQQAVRELLPDQADIATWLDVLTVAAPVAAVAPRLAGDLRDTPL